MPRRRREAEVRATAATATTTMMMVARPVDLDDVDQVDGSAGGGIDPPMPFDPPHQKPAGEEGRPIVVGVGEVDDDAPPPPITAADALLPISPPPPPGRRRKMEISWCNHDSCYEAIREKVVGDHNHLELTGPATGQVVYSWEKGQRSTAMEGGGSSSSSSSSASSALSSASSASSSAAGAREDGVVVVASPPPAVLMLVKRDEDELLAVAADAIARLMSTGVQVLVDSTLMGELAANYDDDIDLDSPMIRLFYPRPVPGFGSGGQLLLDSIACGVYDGGATASDDGGADDGGGGGGGGGGKGRKGQVPADLSDVDLVVTLGGDGLLMHAAQVFSGPVPPILPVAGGSMGFLTPFSRDEMLEAILVALGLRGASSSSSSSDDEDEDGEHDAEEEDDDDGNGGGLRITQRANNHMQIEATTREGYNERPPLVRAFGKENRICISMRMRLDCRIFRGDGSLMSRYAVLNEVVIDRGSSPYLASLECFCDDVHLTTVQADGIIFSTPTGSTAYSMAAGGSVVHPAVPAILVTPICPHVLSFRSMVFPDHVVLRCYVPSDARSTACVYFDGKHRTELNRGDSVQIRMSAHPVPTINRADHSSDWLGSLKRNFNFNTRVRQNPL